MAQHDCDARVVGFLIPCASSKITRFHLKDNKGDASIPEDPFERRYSLCNVPSNKYMNKQKGKIIKYKKLVLKQISFVSSSICEIRTCSEDYII